MTDNNWKIVQRKTFTKWLQTKVKIEDIYTDLRDGTALCELFRIIANVNIIHNRPAITRFQKIENVNNVITFLHASKLKLINIGATDIVDGNEKLILGLIWTIIKNFVIQKQHVTNDSLLNWCKAAVAGYNVDINDFGRSWQNGMAFNAVIHRFKPESFKFEHLRKEDKIGNLNKAFKLAESLGIPSLLDAEDIADVMHPDEKSIMTYLSLYRDKFGDFKEKESKKRIDNFIYAADKIKSIGGKLKDEKNKYVNLMDEIQKNNVKGTIILNELRKLAEKNEDLLNQLGYKKVLLNSILGTIKSISNFYKIKNNDEIEVVKQKIVNEIKMCEKCYTLMGIKIQNTESIVKYSDLLGNTDLLEVQLKKLENLAYNTKDQKILEMIEDKIKLYSALLAKKNTKKLINDAFEMFRQMDKYGKQIIKADEARDILSILGLLDGENNDQNYPWQKEYDSEQFIKLVVTFYDRSYDVVRIKKEVDEGNNKLLNLKMFNSSVEGLNEYIIIDNGEEKLNLNGLFENLTLEK